MNRKDIIPVAVIVALMFAYPFIQRKWFSKPAQPRPPVPAAQATAPATPTAPAPASTPAPTPAAPPVMAATESDASADSGTERPEPVEIVLTNEVARYVLSTRGAGVVHADMQAKRDDGSWLYPLSEEAKDKPVSFDFSNRPAAAYATGPFNANTDFELLASTPRSAIFHASTSGIAIERRVTLDDAYSLTFEDRLVPLAGTTAPSPVSFVLQSGWMGNLPGEDLESRLPLLGVDAFAGTSTTFWSGKLESWFKDKTAGVIQSHPLSEDVPTAEWVAVKDKYFVQIIRPVDLPGQVTVSARRGAPVSTRSFIFFPSTAYPFADVAATIALPPVSVSADADPVVTELYLGPKDYEILKATAQHREDVLELGFWRVIGIWILKLMVWFRDAIWPHNYGLSIILLTLLLRIVFWPLNHKSLASTRRMQEVQPLIAEIREKYKKDPQRLQQEMMRVYKENKINPLGGCLPMLVQIPVFFALFVVLRGAIELRFSSFLWIRDLSAPENLFAGKLPFALNILPIFMGVTMWLQQKMSGSSDPQQKKMMAMMPILFTLLFYSFPSGLSLYWSVNQVLMIVQLALMRRKPAAPAPAKPAVPARK